jgi:uncharacterized protein YukE
VTRYVVPKVSGDAAAAYRLAVAYQDLAEAVATSRRRVAVIMGQLSAGWRGPAHQAADGPVEMFLRNAAALVQVLQDAAAAYETYARQLERAHADHGFSMHKLLAVGAIVAVSTTAIVVTVGAAGVVEAAAASAAVGGASEAAGSALIADAVAASALDSALEALPALRPLLSFVLPHLLQAEWATGAMAVYDESTTGRLRWHALAETGALAFVASGAASKTKALAAGPKWLPHVIEGTTWGGAAAADDELTQHRFSVADVAESFILAGGSTLGRDALRSRGMWPAEPDYRRRALISLMHRAGQIVDPEIAHELALLRQPARQLQRGEVDLRLHEGPGHTIDRHIAKTAGQLLTRVRSSHIPVASTYWDEASARDAIQSTLSTNHDVIRRWIDAGSAKTLRLRLTAPYDLGFAIDRRGMVTFVRHATVVLRRDSAGVVIVTSYPVR